MKTLAILAVVIIAAFYAIDMIDVDGMQEQAQARHEQLNKV